VTAARLSQTAPHGPLTLTFTTSSLPLLDEIFHDQGAAAGIPALTLTVRAGQAAGLPARVLTYSLSSLTIGSFAENLSGSLTGTATLVSRPR
jgi:hypothetical protein